MSLDDAVRQCSSIDALKAEVGPLSGEWGLGLDTVEIRTVQISSGSLFENLQARFRDRARLEASVSALETERAINERRCDEEILRIKAEMETRAVVEELALRKARHEAELASIRQTSERGDIATANTRNAGLALIERLPQIAAALPLRNVEIRADLLGDLMRGISGLGSTSAPTAPILRKTAND